MPVQRRFRGEKTPAWEGAYRVPAMVRWPGKIEPGGVSVKSMHRGRIPTFVAAAGDDRIKRNY
ncbi:sulfatase-like hydrolase/transferase [Vibrio lentus]|nr:sulfatase-like hydrolase/transferase [Vibrio lentus]